MRSNLWLMFCAVAFIACAPIAKGAEDAGFVTVEGTQFRLAGKPYRFVGTNLWYGAYLGSPGSTGDRARLLKELDHLNAIGVNNIRVLGLSEASALRRAVRPAITKKPGQFDEELLTGLDFFLAELAKRDMKAIVYVNNFWQWSGGMAQYVAWFTGQPVVDPDVTGDWDGFMDNSAKFYSMDAAQAAFRDAARMLITRRNTVTGKRYSEDPTIMSWQLGNEPRPGSTAHGRKNAAIFTRWVNDSAKFISELAPSQLVSSGNEGWMGTAGDRELFIDSHKSPHIDYLTFHMWGPNWGWFDPKNFANTYDNGWAKARDYLNWHIDTAQRMDKPIVLEEFGMNRDGGAFAPSASTKIRDRYYREIFALIEKRAAEGAPIAGSNFWAWNGAGRTTNADFMWKPGDDFNGDPPQEAQGLYGIFDSDASTIAIIEAHAKQMKTLSE
jgi:mannan endo-1,4-beta-mannosidase